MLGLHGAPLAGRARAERGDDLGLEVPDDELSHDASNDSTAPHAGGNAAGASSRPGAPLDIGEGSP